jgi:dienelactone hydrolase
MKTKIRVFMCLGILLCLIAGIGKSVINSNAGQTRLHTIKIITESGFELAMNVYVPRTASEKNPGPAILLQHGGNNDKDFMEHFAVELIRRGYVIINVDMYGMGNSEALPDSLWLTAGRGLYDAVRYSLTLPFVDKNRISLLGYSRGGKAASEALELDNKGANVIKSIYLLYSDPIYRNTSGYVDVYGPRDIHLIADKYDDYFFSEKLNDTGVYSNDANKYAANLSSSAEFIINNSAQSFLWFGADPAAAPEKRAAGTLYTKDFGGGRTGTREIVVTNGFHSDGKFNPLVMKDVLEFYSRVMPGTVSFNADNFVYPLNYLFAFLGIIGIFVFISSFSIYCVQEVAFFKSINFGIPEIRAVSGKADSLQAWIFQIAGFVLSVFVYWFVNKLGLSSFRDQIFRSANPFYFSFVSMLCGVVTIIICICWYHFFGKKRSFDPSAYGLVVNKAVFAKTALVVLITILLAVLIIFAVSYFFNADYFFITWGMLPFTARRIPGMLVVLPLFLVYHIVLSISLNCFNYNTAFGKNKIVNSLVQALLTALPPIYIITYCFSLFRMTGWNPMFGGLANAADAVLAFPQIIFLTIICSRIIYMKTGNPYLGGFINGIISVLIVWSQCEIRIPSAGEVYKGQPVVYTLIILSLVVIIAGLGYFYKNLKKAI